MPLEQTVTIVNNSGKIISTGKQLLSIFKEAKGAYQDKKAELQSERSVRRSQTFDAARSVCRHDDSHRSKSDYDPSARLYDRRQIKDGYDDDDDYDYKDDHGHDYKEDHGHDDYYYSYGGRRQSHDAYSETGSRRSRRSSRHHHHHHRHPRGGALTEINLKTLSEVSGRPPSRAPRQQQQPPSVAYRSPYAETMPLDMALSKLDVSQATADAMLVPRRRSEPDIATGGKEIDMNLAYGNIPPDLADRVDLDPGRGSELDRNRAQQLVHKVEGLLDEAHCLQHSATTIIKSLQEKPDAAAEVALTLADLSSAVAKMSPSFLGLLKGGSPAVFALLASPQFLIGTGIAVGVTVVMFGGWKIMKKVTDAQAPREARALEGVPEDRPAPLRTQSDYAHQSSGVEEALVFDEELSTIETWRRGILPFGPGAESADLELITPQADRATRENSRTRKRSKSHRKNSKEKEAFDPKSSGGSRRRSPPDAVSVSGGSDARSKRSVKVGKDRSTKALEDGRGSSKGDGDGLDVVFRPRARHGDNMLKAIFRNKKEKEADGGGSKRELVLA
ncbi:uncharacterized protein HRG_11336 [Hirsutella rhossiliensis]|uniref:Uncharacterized protein n=1 Tax=Hirsutella rhossiliensis TaxID=111463 RepID=A0A9P8MNB6_9HYPO|nr:uncharacterized protein HRG_11336 [Hirsutella rhossiliensis]KAH0957554.1 hypothetical protein HRG_11336 [Hirsutella rhossiliensis]